MGCRGLAVSDTEANKNKLFKVIFEKSSCFPSREAASVQTAPAVPVSLHMWLIFGLKAADVTSVRTPHPPRDDTNLHTYSHIRRRPPPSAHQLITESQTYRLTVKKRAGFSVRFLLVRHRTGDGNDERRRLIHPDSVSLQTGSPS